MQLPLYNMSGEQTGQVNLDPSVFGIQFNEAVVHQALVMHNANRRQGTASTKGRAEVTGSVRKLYRQKHTGNARAGSAKSPLRRGGGVTFGPKPRDYSKSMPKAMRRLAIRCVLSAKAGDNELIVLDDLKFDAPKTKDMAGVIKALGIEGSALIALDETNENVIKSARNLTGVKTMPAKQLNVKDLLGYKKLLITEPALRQIESQWGGALVKEGEAR